MCAVETVTNQGLAGMMEWGVGLGLQDHSSFEHAVGPIEMGGDIVGR